MLLHQVEKKYLTKSNMGTVFRNLIIEKLIKIYKKLAGNIILNGVKLDYPKIRNKKRDVPLTNHYSIL